ncbi:MAG: DUF5820 family protein [Halovenus sp.]
MDDLPDGWVTWSEQTGKVVLAYRPDVFDTEAFPAACLPTIYVTHGRRSRRPGQRRPDDTTPWYVTLYLEPEVDRGADEFESRSAALAGASELARQFADGEMDYRSLYQVPRPAYLDRLDELTGRGSTDSA